MSTDSYSRPCFFSARYVASHCTQAGLLKTVMVMIDVLSNPSWVGLPALSTHHVTTFLSFVPAATYHRARPTVYTLHLVVPGRQDPHISCACRVVGVSSTVLTDALVEYSAPPVHRCRSACGYLRPVGAASTDSD